MIDLRQTFKQQQARRIAFPMLRKGQWRRNDYRGIPVMYRCTCDASSGVRETEIDASGCFSCWSCKEQLRLVGYATELAAGA